MGATPWPLKDTVCGRVTALSESVMVPLVARLLTGVKVNWTGQTPPAAIESQLCATVTVGSDEVIVEILSGAFPQLAT